MPSAPFISLTDESWRSRSRRKPGKLEEDTMKFGVRLARLVLALTVTSACAALPAGGDVVAEGTFERTLSVSGEADLDVTTGAGEINVRTGDPASVRVIGTVRVRKVSRSLGEEKVRYLTANPPIEQNGNVVRIGRIDNREMRENVSISYEIVTPPQ